MNNKLLALLSTASLVGSAGVAGVATVACGSSSDTDQYTKITELRAINGNYALWYDPAKPGGIECPYPEAILEQLTKAMGLVNSPKTSLTIDEITALETVMPISYSVQFQAKPHTGVNGKASEKDKTNLPSTFSIKLDTLAKEAHNITGSKTTNYFYNFEPSYNYISSIKNFSITSGLYVPGFGKYDNYDISFDKMFASIYVPTKADVEAKQLSTDLATKINAGITAANYQPGSTNKSIPIQATNDPTSPVDGIEFTLTGFKAQPRPDYSAILLNLYNNSYYPDITSTEFNALVLTVEVVDLTNSITSVAEGDQLAVKVTFNSAAEAKKKSSTLTDTDIFHLSSFFNSNDWDVKFSHIQTGAKYIANIINGEAITIAKANTTWNTAKEGSGLLHDLEGEDPVALDADNKALFNDISDNVITAISKAIDLAESKLSSDRTNERTDLLDIFDLKADFVKDNKPSTPVTSSSSAKTNAYSKTTAPKLKVMITNVQDLNALVPKTEFGLKLINWLYQKGVTNGEAVTVTDAHQTPVAVKFKTK